MVNVNNTLWQDEDDEMADGDDDDDDDEDEDDEVMTNILVCGWCENPYLARAAPSCEASGFQEETCAGGFPCRIYPSSKAAKDERDCSVICQERAGPPGQRQEG